MGMLKTIAQAWKVAEIRSKMIFTLLMLVVFRIGSQHSGSGTSTGKRALGNVFR